MGRLPGKPNADLRSNTLFMSDVTAILFSMVFDRVHIFIVHIWLMVFKFVSRKFGLHIVILY